MSLNNMTNTIYHECVVLSEFNRSIMIFFPMCLQLPVICLPGEPKPFGNLHRGMGLCIFHDLFVEDTGSLLFSTGFSGRQDMLGADDTLQRPRADVLFGRNKKESWRAPRPMGFNTAKRGAGIK